ncbi:MAG: metallophosphoesterase [Gemmatimonadota bacterium]|nr:metallophosphoesterase [Gemmatimonadota bacterium]
MPVHFVFVTDSHHYPDAPEDFSAPKMLTQSRRVLDAMPVAINALNPDFIVHGGDLLCGGSSFKMPWETYVRAVGEAAAACSQFQAPTYYVPGNHDSDAQQASFDLFAQHIQIPYILDVVDVGPRWRLAVANVYHDCSPISEAAGVWTEALDQALRNAARTAEADGRALILALHPWVVPHASQQDNPEPHGVIFEAARIQETIKTHPAISMILTGHYHRNRISLFHDCLILDTACLIGYPMGFREIWIEDNGTFRTRFHTLDLPDVIEASIARSTPKENAVWAGRPVDRDVEMGLSRWRE